MSKYIIIETNIKDKIPVITVYDNFEKANEHMRNTKFDKCEMKKRK